MPESSLRVDEIGVEEVPSDYFDLDVIAAQDSHFACSFELDTPVEIFDMLDVKQQSVTGKKEIQLDIPLWLVPTLSSHCKLFLPKIYSLEVQNVLEGHPCSTDLGSMQHDYYGVGMAIARVVGDAILARCLLATFARRIGHFISKALQGATKLKKMDKEEHHILHIAVASQAKALEWSAPTKKRKARSD